MVLKIEIDLEKCSHCRTCIDSCNYGSLEWFEEDPVVVNPSACGRCFECVKNCPAEAIKIIER